MNRFFSTVLLLSALSFSLNAQETEGQTRVVSVMGEARMELPADYARISLSARAEASEAAAALEEVSSKMSEVISYLKKQKVVEDVSTDFVNLSPVGSYPEKTARNFRAVQQLSFKLNDLSQYDRLMADLLDLGVNGVSGVSFHSNQTEKAEQELMTRAVLDARKKATILAAGLGQRLGEAVYISDHQEQGPQPQAMLMESKSSFNSGPSIAPGELELTMAVKVRFILN